MKRLIGLVLLLVLPIMAPSAAPTSVNTYEIEIIVFENRLSDLEGGELWRPERIPAAAAKEEPAVLGEKNPGESTLSTAKNSLEKSGRHRVLAHQRWQQSAEAKSVSKPVKISSLARELEGALRFYSSRVLIVELNLALKKEGVTGAMTAGTPENGPLVHRLNESRRIKISEAHYFDHPKFGALVRVSSLKGASPASGVN